MQCRHHPDQSVDQTCGDCHEQVCASCLVLGAKIRCLRCAQKLLDAADGKPAAAAVAAPPKQKKRAGAGPVVALFGAIIAIGVAAPLLPYLCGSCGSSPQRAISGFIGSLAEGEQQAAVWVEADNAIDLAALRAELGLAAGERCRASLVELRRSGEDGAVATVLFRSGDDEKTYRFALVQAARGWRVTRVEKDAPACCSSGCSY